jgi:hypothetical protein
MGVTRCGIIGADARPNWREQSARLSGAGHRAMALSAERHRALEILAGTEATLLAHGFTTDLLVEHGHVGDGRVEGLHKCSEDHAKGVVESISPAAAQQFSLLAATG